MQAHNGAAIGGEQANNTANPVKPHGSQSGRPIIGTRKNSFGDTFNRFTDKANLFSHRRRMTTATLPSSDSLGSVSITQTHQSRLPTPSGIPRSSSFFGSLNSLITPNSNENTDPSTSTANVARRYRKVSEKFIQLPFFSHENQVHSSQRQLSPRTKRESSIKIEHRGLMAPIQPAPMPRSSTMSNVTQQHGIMATPSFMRPTSSSAKRRQSTNGAEQNRPTLPRLTSSSRSFLKAPVPNHGPHRQTVKSPPSNEWESPLASSSTRCFPTQKDSLGLRHSPPARAVAPAAKICSELHKAAMTHQNSLPRSAHMPPATRIPTPAASLLTPEYEDSNEDERDKRATYTQPLHKPHTEDGGEMTATEETDKAQMLCYVRCNCSSR